MAASVVASVALPISNNFSFAPSMDAYGKLSEYGKLGAWSPLSLFALGEQGAWYDPSDLSTMFQDSAGTLPVTADGQPVGLILDKSKGLVLGPELVTNGSFDVGTGWSLTNSTISGGKLVCNAVGSVFLATQSVAFTYPKSYELNVVISGLVSGNLSVVFGVGVNVSSPILVSNGAYKFIIASGSGNSELRLMSLGSGFVGNVDSISIKEISGNPATAPSDAARPLKTSTGASKWVNYDAIDDVLNATFPSSLGSSCTVCRANVGGAPTILTGQTIGTSYADSTDHAGLIIINRALTGQETTDVTAWLTAKGAT